MAAITAAEIQQRLSNTTGPGNSTAGVPATSLGDFISSTQVTAASLNNLFDDISGPENAASTIDYRCYFVYNSNGANAWENPVVWIQSETASGASIALSVDTTAASALASASPQAKEIVNELTAPATQTFTSPTTEGTGLPLSNIPNGQVKGVWVRRTAANTAAVSNDGAVIRHKGDTGSL